MQIRIIPTLAFLTLLTASTPYSHRAEDRELVVVIDPAHGGKDGGWCDGDLSEKDIVLDIALQIRELNTRPNLKIVLLRENDQFLSLKERAERIAEIAPDRVISLHTDDSKHGTREGVQIFLNHNDSQRHALGESMKSAFEPLAPVHMREGEALNLFVLKHYPAPTAMLEFGYSTEPNPLLDPAYRQKLALAVLEGIR